MNQKERDWLDWLKQAKAKTITQRKAAENMEVEERWVRTLLKRMKRKGDCGGCARPTRPKIQPQACGETQREAIALVQR